MLKKLKFLALFAVMLAPQACDRGAVPEIGYQVAATFPHDPGAYTQGLLFHDGVLYESTGQYGTSTLRKVDAQTGEVLASVAIDSTFFAEGLARVGSELIQLTWKSEVAFVYDLETLELKRQFEYSGEGWGLCYDGTSLFMSNGSSKLSVRDPVTFQIQSEIEVTKGGFALASINELECVGEHIYANVYLTDKIVKIDKASGEVVGELDGFELSLASRRPGERDAVLNGIAYIEETGIFLVTGKLWPSLFALRLDGP